MSLQVHEPERRNLFDVPPPRLTQEQYDALEWVEIKAIPSFPPYNTPPPLLTPQELADLPYAGMAEKELKKAGKWDEYAGCEEKSGL